MGGGLSAQRVDDLRAEFVEMDVDNNNDVSLNELKSAHMKHDGDAYDEAKVEAEFNKLDKNHDNRVQLHEYLESYGVSHDQAMVIEQEESVRRAMEAIDAQDAEDTAAAAAAAKAVVAVESMDAAAEAAAAETATKLALARPVAIRATFGGLPSQSHSSMAAAGGVAGAMAAGATLAGAADEDSAEAVAAGDAAAPEADKAPAAAAAAATPQPKTAPE